MAINWKGAAAEPMMRSWPGNNTTNRFPAAAADVLPVWGVYYCAPIEIAPLLAGVKWDGINWTRRPGFSISSSPPLI